MILLVVFYPFETNFGPVIGGSLKLSTATRTYVSCIQNNLLTREACRLIDNTR